MQSKLTLRLEEKLIVQAKEWARLQGISLSEAVAQFFAQLTTAQPQESTLSPWTRHLAGAAAPSGRSPTDEEIRRDHRRHVEEKHR